MLGCVVLCSLDTLNVVDTNKWKIIWSHVHYIDTNKHYFILSLVLWDTVESEESTQFVEAMLPMLFLLTKIGAYSIFKRDFCFVLFSMLPTCQQSIVPGESEINETQLVFSKY